MADDMTMTPDEIDAFLREPIICDIATIRPDGSPHVTPVWHHWDGERLIIMTAATAVKTRNIRRDPRVSCCIATHAAPFKYVLVNGVAELSRDNIPAYLSAMAHNYMEEAEAAAYVKEASGMIDFVVITITPTKIISWVSPE